MKKYEIESDNVRKCLREWLDALGYAQMEKDIDKAPVSDFPKYARVINNAVSPKSFFKANLVKGLTYFELI